MSEDRLEKEIQEYLDGRMNDHDRQEFEDLLRNEPGVWTRVESFRHIGRTIRENSVNPPEGFHKRLRERFEESHNSKASWRRLVSLEAAGLAAAAVVLTAIMLPTVFEKEYMGEVTTPPPAALSEEADDLAEGSAVRQEEAESGTVEDKDQEPLRTPEPVVAEEPGEPEVFSPVTQMPEKKEAAVENQKRLRVDATPVEERQAFAERTSPPRSEKGFATMQASEIIIARTAALPEGAIPEGKVIQILSNEFRYSMEYIEARAAIDALSPDFRQERVLLIDGKLLASMDLDCQNIGYRTGPSGLELVPTGPGRAQPVGCAVLLPLHPETVSFPSR